MRFDFIPSGTKFDFLRIHKLAFLFSATLCLISLVSLATRGLNFGVDFSGGVMIEVRTIGGPADMGQMRATLGGLGFGDVALQEFGAPTDVLIRLPQQEGGEKAQLQAVEKVRQALAGKADFRRVEVVGPKVGSELVRGGIIAIILSLFGILAYMWFRFEWQFGIAGVVALVHDCLTTVGLFSLFQFEFNLNVLAAVLTIAGFSINDTVVIDDRIRENMRKYKALDWAGLINRSVNETLSRTIITNGTAFLAVLALYLFGGPVLAGFSAAMVWGVLIGTYSTVYVASPMLLYMQPSRVAAEDEAARPA